MEKQRIKTIAQTGVNQWTNKQGVTKDLVKWLIHFENNTSGTLTTGFDETPPPVVGAELEYTIEDRGFGIEIKLPRKGGFGGGGGGRPESPEKARSIQRQTALKEAVNFVLGLDEKFRSSEGVLKCADKFAGWLAIAPPAPAPVQQVIPPAQAIPVTPQQPAEPGDDNDLPF